jgi:hypothetical protein
MLDKQIIPRSLCETTRRCCRKELPFAQRLVLSVNLSDVGNRPMTKPFAVVQDPIGSGQHAQEDRARIQFLFDRSISISCRFSRSDRSVLSGHGLFILLWASCRGRRIRQAQDAAGRIAGIRNVVSYVGDARTSTAVTPRCAPHAIFPWSMSNTGPRIDGTEHPGEFGSRP